MATSHRSRHLPKLTAVRLVVAAAALVAVGLVLPDPALQPVRGAGPGDWHPESFWYYPWGPSVVHKGVDIFASAGTPVVSASYGVVAFAGPRRAGGKVLLVLGPKWRLHYYAHLASIDAVRGSLLRPGDPIGTVGTTGNAAGKPPHLHLACLTLVPHPWRIDDSPQGWKKAFFLDPVERITP